jgi:hypothetical protein
MCAIMKTHETPHVVSYIFQTMITSAMKPNSFLPRARHRKIVRAASNEVSILCQPPVAGNYPRQITKLGELNCYMVNRCIV